MWLKQQTVQRLYLTVISSFLPISSFLATDNVHDHLLFRLLLQLLRVIDMWSKHRNVTIYRCNYTCMTTRTCMYIWPYVHPLYIYTLSYQTKVSIAGMFAALSLIVIAKVQKLSFWRWLHECYSCECCVVLFSWSPDRLRWCFQTTRSKWFSRLHYRHLGRSYAKITHCLTEEGHRATKVGVHKFLHQRRNVQRQYYTNMLHLPSLITVNISTKRHKQLALQFHQALQPLRFVTM